MSRIIQITGKLIIASFVSYKIYSANKYQHNLCNFVFTMFGMLISYFFVIYFLCTLQCLICVDFKTRVHALTRTA
jgi:hypothetical protein